MSLFSLICSNFSEKFFIIPFKFLKSIQEIFLQLKKKKILRIFIRLHNCLIPIQHKCNHLLAPLKFLGKVLGGALGRCNWALTRLPSHVPLNGAGQRSRFAGIIIIPYMKIIISSGPRGKAGANEVEPVV